MPSPRVLKNGHRAGQREALKSVQKFLESRNIKSECVLNYICFNYKGEDIRAKTVLEAKIKMNIA